MIRRQLVSLMPDLAILIGGFLLVQIALVTLLPASLQGNDSSDFRDFYYPIAQRLASGTSLVAAHYFDMSAVSPAPVQRGGGILITRFPPGYSVILSQVIGLANLISIRHSAAFAVMTSFFALVNALLLYFILRIGLRDRAAAVVGSLIWMVYPPALFLTKQPNSENPFLAIVFVAILLQVALRPSLMRAAGIAVCLGLAIYVRQAGLFLPVVFLAVLIGERLLISPNKAPLLLSAAATVLIPYLVVSPWVWTIYQETGRFVPVASTGADLLRLSYSEILRSVPASSWLWSDALRDYVASRAASGDYAFSPWMELRLLSVKVLRAFYGTFTLRQEPVLIALQFVFFAMTAIGFWRTWQNRTTRLFHLTAWLLFGYFLATSAVGIPLLRYTLPGQALLTGYIAVALIYMTTMVLAKRTRTDPPVSHQV